MKMDCYCVRPCVVCVGMMYVPGGYREEAQRCTRNRPLDDGRFVSIASQADDLQCSHGIDWVMIPDEHEYRRHQGRAKGDSCKGGLTTTMTASLGMEDDKVMGPGTESVYDRLSMLPCNNVSRESTCQGLAPDLSRIGTTAPQEETDLRKCICTHPKRQNVPDPSISFLC